MSPTLPTPSATDPMARAVPVLEAYLERLERGESVTPEELLAEHPDLVDQLRACLASLEFLHDAALSLRGQGGASLTAVATEAIGELGDFRIVREVGRGGMGVVYEAEQVSLGRRVALKVLPFAAALDPRQLQRFRNEAHAAAQLHHTHIVPVYAVGCERGIHYYAMQYIEGRTLASVLADLRCQAGLDAGAAEPSPTTGATPPVAAASTERSRLNRAQVELVARLGAEAAEALEHAHQLGIIHRDVKPANLMVDCHGHLWVTDFGLAQIRAEARLTQTGDLVGTLTYMSPEQALGIRGGVDHRTDVYALGVTLYELVTLRSPFQSSDRQHLLWQIAHEDPPRPRRLNRDLPGELEIIILKALAKNPTERYASAGELAEDLRRFLADQPIRARRPSLVQILSRKARRHRAILATATLGLLVLLAGTVAGLMLHNLRLEEEQRLTHQQWARAEDEKTQAEQQRNRAEAHLERALRAINAFHTRVSDGRLLGEPHLRSVRKELLTEAMHSYEELCKEESENRRVRLELVEARLRLAQIIGEVGSRAESLALIQRGIKEFIELAAEAPDDRDRTFGLARAEFWLGETHQRLGEKEAAERALGSAIARCAELDRTAPADPETLRFWSRACVNRALVRTLVDRRAEAEGDLREALLLAERHHAQEAGSGPAREDLANVLAHLGTCLQSWGREEEAEEHLARAVEMREALLRETPGDTGAVFELTKCRFYLGKLYATLGRRAEAQTTYEHARDLAGELNRRHPGVPDYRFHWALALHGLGELASAGRRFTEAEGPLTQALLLAESLARQQPTFREYRRLVACCHLGLAVVRLNQRRLEDAKQACLKAQSVLGKLVEEATREFEYRYFLAGCHLQLGRIHAASRKPAEAEAAFRLALAEAQQLDREHPGIPLLTVSLASTHFSLGNHLKDQNQLPEALVSYGEAITLLDGLLNSEPRRSSAKFYLRGALAGRAVTYGRLKRRAEALADVERALSYDDGSLRKQLESLRAEVVALPQERGPDE